MSEPKVIKGWLGWAVADDELLVYASTRAEALRRYWSKVGKQPQDDSLVTEDVADAGVEALERRQCD